jgi:hypothetical protein
MDVMVMVLMDVDEQPGQLHQHFPVQSSHDLSVSCILYFAAILLLLLQGIQLFLGKAEGMCIGSEANEATGPWCAPHGAAHAGGLFVGPT